MYTIKHFKDLTVGEFYEIAKARYEVFACEQQITCENDFDDVDKNCYHIFRQENGLITAYARIIPKDFSPYNDTAVGRVLVVENSRRRGIAKDLMSKTIDFINNELNEKHITLSAQEYVKKLYLDCGFKEISDVYDDAGIPHIKMRY